MNGCCYLFAFKVACVVNIIFFFFGLIFLKFNNTNQFMENPRPKFSQSSIVSKKPGYLSEKLKTDEVQPP